MKTKTWLSVSFLHCGFMVSGMYPVALQAKSNLYMAGILYKGEMS